MTKYKIPNLSSKTTQVDQTKLLDAVKAVQGVESAQLYPGSNELGITPRQKQTPKHDEIASAASKAGFPLAPKM